METQLTQIKRLHIHHIPRYSPEFCYYLGYLWADGFIDRNPVGYGIYLEIQEEDGLSILDNLLSIMLFSIKKRQRPGRKPSLTFSINSKVIKNFLFQNDYQNKSIASADKILSLIPESLKHYWFRGYFDGDGNFSVINQTVDNKFKRFEISCYGSYNQNWTFIEKQLNDLNIQYKIIKRVRSSGLSSLVLIGKRRDVIKFGKFLYQGKDFGLKRKKEKWLLATEYDEQSKSGCIPET